MGGAFAVVIKINHIRNLLKLTFLFQPSSQQNNSEDLSILEENLLLHSSLLLINSSPFFLRNQYCHTSEIIFSRNPHQFLVFLQGLCLGLTAAFSFHHCCIQK